MAFFTLCGENKLPERQRHRVAASQQGFATDCTDKYKPIQFKKNIFHSGLIPCFCAAAATNNSRSEYKKILLLRSTGVCHGLHRFTRIIQKYCCCTVRICHGLYRFTRIIQKYCCCTARVCHGLHRFTQIIQKYCCCAAGICHGGTEAQSYRSMFN